jgi:hypothetical protein
MHLKSAAECETRVLAEVSLQPGRLLRPGSYRFSRSEVSAVSTSRLWSSWKMHHEILQPRSFGAPWVRCCIIFPKPSSLLGITAHPSSTIPSHAVEWEPVIGQTFIDMRGRKPACEGIPRAWTYCSLSICGLVKPSNLGVSHSTTYLGLTIRHMPRMNSKLDVVKRSPSALGLWRSDMVAFSWKHSHRHMQPHHSMPVIWWALPPHERNGSRSSSINVTNMGILCLVVLSV